MHNYVTYSIQFSMWHRSTGKRDVTHPNTKRRETKLSLCDNSRGISLLDVLGKALAKVIHARLQEDVEGSSMEILVW